jgi:hypothetical protein
MLKYFLIGVSVLAVAASGAALTDLGDLEYSKTGSGITTSSFSRQDEIYMDQSFGDAGEGSGYCTNGLSIYGGAGYESADDYEPDDDVTVGQVVVWLSGSGVDLRVDFFEGATPSDAPPADFYNCSVSSGDITWENTGYSYFGYPCMKCTIPIDEVDLAAGDHYWLGVQTTTGSNTFWWSFDYGTYGGPYWTATYFYYISYWTPGQSVFGSPYDSFYELWGSSGPPDEEDPTITDMYPMDEDWPSGIPPEENMAGCHWQDGDEETNKGIDTELSEFTVYDPDDEVVGGSLDIDESDLYDVIVDFEADDPWTEGATYTVETTAYDLAGNSAEESWTFDVGYTNIKTESLGAIKANFR